ncbi:MAG: undecaprenyl-diphosphate phosphatase [Thermotogota bacterium]
MNEIILGIVQGFTEFLPVSSSGHLTIISEFINFKQDPSFFALLHLATFFAVFIFVFSEIKQIIIGLFKWEKETLTLILKLLVSTIPAVIVGLVLEDYFKGMFDSVNMAATFLIITSIMMFSSDFFNKDKTNMLSLSYFNALIIGLFQAFAIFPGISRSGATLFAALMLGMNKKSAVKYSFLMSLPVTFGAGILEIGNVDFNSSVIFGVISAFIAGLVGLFLVKKSVINGKLKIFAFYTLAMAIFTFLYF